MKLRCEVGLTSIVISLTCCGHANQVKDERLRHTTDTDTIDDRVDDGHQDFSSDRHL